MMNAAASDPGTARRSTRGGGTSYTSPSEIQRKFGNLFDVFKMAPDPPHFNVPRAITQRRLGMKRGILQSTRFNQHPLYRRLPQRRIVQNWGDRLACDFWGSVGIVKKLKISSMLPHGSCVTALDFSPDGNYLVSGSGDSNVNIWSWAAIEAFPAGGRLSRPPATFQRPPHRRSFFPGGVGSVGPVRQTKFVMYSRHGPTHIAATTSVDPTVRLIEVDSTGDLRSNIVIAKHENNAVKIAVTTDESLRLLSCSLHGTIYSTDLRTSNPSNLGVKGNFHSIATNPANLYDFVVTEDGQTVFPEEQPSILIFDLRNVRSGPKQRFEEAWMYGSLDPPSHHPWTEAVYNWNGTEVLASRETVDALFSFSSETGELLFEFYGLSNNIPATKGLNYFGCRSEFVVAGSEDNNVWIWEAKTGMIAHVLNSINVVRVVEPHPTIPALATAGFGFGFPHDEHRDYDAKIWLPLENKDPQVLQVRSC